MPRAVLKQPVVTDKAIGMNERGKYTFVVDSRATKNEIRKAVETTYGVNVTKVNVVKKVGRAKRFRGIYGRPPREKRATVTLRPGQKIEVT